MCSVIIPGIIQRILCSTGNHAEVKHIKVRYLNFCTIWPSNRLFLKLRTNSLYLGINILYTYKEDVHIHLMKNQSHCVTFLFFSP